MSQQNRFQSLKNKSSMGLIPFFVLGYPNKDECLKMIDAALKCNIAGLELGIPFSDPMADGPVIQQAMEVALKNNLQWQDYCDIVAYIRKKTELPIGLLVYSNLLYQRGFEKALADLSNAGLDGILPVDVPLEEDAQFSGLYEKYHLGRIHLIAPNTPVERAQKLMNASTAFTYVLSRYGITGMSKALPEDLQSRIDNLLAIKTESPLVIGFGISHKQHLQLLEKTGIHAAIVGSALVNEIKKGIEQQLPLEKIVHQFLEGLTYEPTS